MVKLTALKGSENLPKKKEDNPELHTCYDGGSDCSGCFIDGENTTINEYNSLSIDGDVEALAMQLSILDKNYVWEKLDEWEKVVYRKRAIKLIANLDKFVVIRKG